MNQPAGEATSINQKPSHARRTPDFRNVGVALRVLVIAHLCAGATAMVQSAAPDDLATRALLIAGRLELPLFLTVLALYVLQPWLAARGYAAASVLAVLLATLATVLTEILAGSGLYAVIGAALWAAACAVLVLAYFDYRDQLLSPSLAEARLQALTVRMRPHFLFNSLNAVLGVIRSDPRRAEQALEEMSDVFRSVMKENRELITIGDELELCERYLGLERLRLGDRLRVREDLDGVPMDALIPPLMLQPILENAVYHGIEPLSDPGEVALFGTLKGGDLVLEVSNPRAPAGSSHAGNQMAMENIRERLMLFYDLEASLSIESDEQHYRVRIRVPYRRKSA